MPRGTDSLPPEIWVVVFIHARLPVPPPLSNPSRSALRQQSLCVLARCCKLFNALAMPMLYRTVVTDDLAHLLDPSQQIPSRRRHLALVETLYVEMNEQCTETPYSYILLEGSEVWDTVGADADQTEKSQMERCGREANALFHAIDALYEQGVAMVLPLLSSVAIGSLYGHQGNLWSRYMSYSEDSLDIEDADGPWHAHVADCVQAWEALIGESNVKHICVRDLDSPLTIPLYSSKFPDPSRTIHFACDTPGVAFHSGRNATWVSDVPQGEAWTPLWEALWCAMDEVPVMAPGGRLGRDGDPIQVEIYGSTNHLGQTPPPLGVFDPFLPPPITSCTGNIPGAAAEKLSVDTQRAIAGELGKRLSEKGLESRSNADAIRWFPSQDYGGCQACGSRPPL